VREHVDEDGDAAGAVAFVADFLELLPLELAGAALDGALDVVLGHGDFARLVDGVAKLEVHGRIAAAMTGGDDDGPAQLAPQLAALGVDGAFLVLDRRPMGMAGHGSSFASQSRTDDALFYAIGRWGESSGWGRTATEETPHR